MLETKLVNRHHGVPFDVYIGRGSIYGNPFTHMKNTSAEFVVKDRETAIAEFRKWVVTQDEIMNNLYKLRGKTLGCYCSPLPCHGDVYIELLEKLPMKVLITGGRDWKNRTKVIKRFRQLPINSIIIHGDAKGADTICDKIAKVLGYETKPYPADWNLGNKAGAIRNTEMLIDNPDIELCIAFPTKNSKGTWDMVRKAKARGIPVEIIR